MKYFVLMVMTSGLAGCPGISWDIGIGECDGARISRTLRLECASDQRVACKVCSEGECSRVQCVTTAQQREYLQSRDGSLPDGWLPGLGDGGVQDGGPEDE